MQRQAGFERHGLDDPTLDGLRACLSGIGATDLTHRPASSPRAASSAFEGDSPEGPVLVDVARSDEGRSRILAEVHGRLWASAGGVRTPSVVDHDASGLWMVSRRAASPARDERYVDEALDAAEAVAAITAPLPELAQASSWRAGRRGRVSRVMRCVAEGLPVPLFRRARSAYESLPHDSIGHGDFYYRNVLADDRGICLIDWEFVGRQPRYTDQMRFWATLPEQPLRDRVLARTLDSADPNEHADIGTVALWMSLRLLAENAGVPRSQRNATTLEVARSGLHEAREVAQRLASPGLGSRRSA